MKASETGSGRQLTITAGRFAVPALLSVVAIGALAALWCTHRPKAQKTVLDDGTVLAASAGSTWQAAAGFPDSRELRIDGEFLIEAATAPVALTVRSRLLLLTVMGHSKFHVIAHSQESGEEVEVLFGNVTVHKNYPSQHDEPDRLGPGEMSMVNQTIDLMEKERFDVSEAATWQKIFP
jgi:hypothetical protein